MPPKKKSPTKKPESQASNNEKITAVIEKVESQLEAQRQQLTLLRSPWRTTQLFTQISIRWISSLIHDFIKHPMTLYILCPLLLVFFSVSLFFVPPSSQMVFAQMDSNGDGFVTPSEVLNYHLTTFGNTAEVPEELTEKHIASTFHEALSSLDSDDGAVNQSAKANKDKNSKIIKLNLQEFQIWWDKDDDDEAREKHRAYHGWIRETEYFVADVIWWVGLGILSSVGLGTGMHSGLLFLFPHIYLICAAADGCKHTNFWTYPVNIFYGPRERVFECITPALTETAGVSIWGRTLKVMLWCILWGGGTAIGEIPPYALTYAAALQGKKTEELEEVSKFDVVNRMKNWMLNKIQKYGFWAILLLAAWPNMAFDLCGMACGQFLMPFWTFFGATFIGKALFKVNFQAVFFVAIFSGTTLHNIVEDVGIVFESVLPRVIPVQKFVGLAVKAIDDTHKKIEMRAKGVLHHHHEEAGGEGGGAGKYLQVAMQWIVLLAVGWFAKSIVDTFAQQKQKEMDEEKVVQFQKKLEERVEEHHSGKEVGSSHHSHSIEEIGEEMIHALHRSRLAAHTKVDDIFSLLAVSLAMYSCFFAEIWTPALKYLFFQLAAVLALNCLAWGFFVPVRWKIEHKPMAIALRLATLIPVLLHLPGKTA